MIILLLPIKSEAPLIWDCKHHTYFIFTMPHQAASDGIPAEASKNKPTGKYPQSDAGTFCGYKQFFKILMLKKFIWNATYVCGLPGFKIG